MTSSLRAHAPDSRRRIQIDFYFDLICPWCLIGKRRLERAIDLIALGYPDVEVVVRWKSLPLLPQLPIEGVPFSAFYLKRLGSPEAVAARRQQIRDEGLAAGVTFCFELIERMPNTVAAHQLVEWAGTTGGSSLQASLIESLFEAYFLYGQDIGDRRELTRIGEMFGIEHTASLALMEPSTSDALLQRWLGEARRLGLSGVPAIVHEGRVLHGALPPEALARALLDFIPA
ncbi:DsbA family oxidoreductase [Dyella solisilvae]|uniref:DsbA family oxidoreductase n=1 Tax=Dyella solisilvae TaxID=1920168 RepID=A0A370KAK9_9GAMM|nr:DsbA family oxidoreductase [Dyella solisilvae]RDI99693.1 DsbA family oxidoreductase [Dyella solisilvae]